VKKASEYQQHAEDCKALAAGATSPEHRDMLLKMAETWESLARNRESMVTRQQRIANLRTASEPNTVK
jgi:hypothetical protein